MNVENTNEVINFLTDHIDPEDRSYIMRSLENKSVNVAYINNHKHFCIVYKDKDGTLQSAYGLNAMDVYYMMKNGAYVQIDYKFRKASLFCINQMIDNEYQKIQSRYLHRKWEGGIHRTVPFE